MVSFSLRQSFASLFWLTTAGLQPYKNTGQLPFGHNPLGSTRYGSMAVLHMTYIPRCTTLCPYVPTATMHYAPFSTMPLCNPTAPQHYGTRYQHQPYTYKPVSLWHTPLPCNLMAGLWQSWPYDQWCTWDTTRYYGPWQSHSPTMLIGDRPSLFVLLAGDRTAIQIFHLSINYSYSSRWQIDHTNFLSCQTNICNIQQWHTGKLYRSLRPPHKFFIWIFQDTIRLFV